MNNIAVDAGFLIGLYDNSDQYHERASAHFDEYFLKPFNQLIVPFPIVYETLSTRFIKNRQAMMLLNKDWQRMVAEKRLELVSDAPFRDTIVVDCFSELQKPFGQYRALSFVDRILRRMLSEVDLRISAFITFNPGDFADVCAEFRRELIS